MAARSGKQEDKFGPHDHPLTGEPLIGDLTFKQGKKKMKKQTSFNIIH